MYLSIDMHVETVASQHLLQGLSHPFHADAPNPSQGPLSAPWQPQSGDGDWWDV